MLLTKCNAMQAGHRTGTWAFCGGVSEPTSSSRCWTFMPVRGHLKRIWRSIGRTCARSRAVEIAVDYLRCFPERAGALEMGQGGPFCCS